MTSRSALRGTVTALLLSVACAALWGCSGDAKVRIGSKKFTESVVLGEIARQLMEHDGVRTEHLRELGGTRILWGALVQGELDAYPEYLGTLREEILAAEHLGSDEAVVAALAARGIVVGAPLGFDNSYAIGMRKDTAARLGIRSISDLAAHRDAVLGFGHEFIDRADGWPALRARYRMSPKEVRGLDHAVAYRALAGGEVTAIEVYTTDAEIALYDLAVLEDDLHHFPTYDAVFLWRKDLEARAPNAVRALRSVEGRVSADAMMHMNTRATVERVSDRRVAADFLGEVLGVDRREEEVSVWSRIGLRTQQHLFLVAVSLLLALLVAVPLGIVAARHRAVGQATMGVVGILQTIPSMALLVLMIPLLGIGTLPALAAMFVYSLLPILRNTATGLTEIAPGLLESAAAMGLTPGARLWLVELPIASRSILAGVKTSAVLNVGTATLGALIGAGGYGQPILRGIRLDHFPTILEGALPAAVMAVVVQGVFELAERVFVPRGLR